MSHTVLIAFPGSGLPTEPTRHNLAAYSALRAWEPAASSSRLASSTVLLQMHELGRWLASRTARERGPVTWTEFGVVSLGDSNPAAVLLARQLECGCMADSCRQPSQPLQTQTQCDDEAAARVRTAIARQTTELALAGTTSAAARRTEHDLSSLYAVMGAEDSAAPPRKAATADLVRMLMSVVAVRDLVRCEEAGLLFADPPLARQPAPAADVPVAKALHSDDADSVAVSPAEQVTAPLVPTREQLRLSWASLEFLRRASHWLVDAALFAPTVLPHLRAAGGVLLSHAAGAALAARPQTASAASGAPPARPPAATAACFVAADEPAFLAVLAALRLKHPPEGYCGAGAFLLLEADAGVVSALWCPDAFPYARDGRADVPAPRGARRLFDDLPVAAFADMLRPPPATGGGGARSGAALGRYT